MKNSRPETDAQKMPAGGRLQILSKPAFQIPFVAAFAALCFFGKLNRGELRTLDAATYAQIAKEMYNDGGSLAPRYGGEIVYENIGENREQANKPPLFFWLVGISYFFFGVGRFGATFIPALSAVALCVLVYLVAWIYDRRWLGFFAAVMLATTPYFMKQSRTCRPDSLFVCFLALAVLAYVLTERRGYWWLLAGGALGLAVMTKQVAALVGVLVIGVDMIVSGRWRELKGARPWLGLTVMVAVAAPWHIAMLALYGGDFVEGYLYPVKSIVLSDYSVKSWSFYLKGLAKFLPWILLVPAGAVLAARGFRKENLYRLAAVWALVAIAVFLLTRTKRLWYLFPALPPLAIIAAVPVTRLLKEKWRRIAAFVVALVSAGTTVAAIAFPFEVDKIEFKDIRESRALLDRLAPGGTVYEFVEKISPRKGAKTTLAAVTLFYTDHPVQPVTVQTLAPLLEEKGNLAVICEKGRLDALLEAARSHAGTQVEFAGNDYSIVSVRKKVAW